MVSQISIGASPVIRFGLGLCFLASVMAFDMTLNTNVSVSLSMSPVHAEYMHLPFCLVGRVCVPLW